ncbi:MAG: hypothetical protein Q4B99_04725 [Clostridia bacterium]|nr:hypothetical protein [Clostridia bacterium]
MKKLFVIIVALIAVCVLSGCTPEPPYDIAGATSVEITKYDPDSAANATISIDSEEHLQRLIEQFMTLSLTKQEYSEPSVTEYVFVFSAGDGILARLTVPSHHTWVGYGGYDYAIIDGQLDTALFEALFASHTSDMTQSAADAISSDDDALVEVKRDTHLHAADDDCSNPVTIVSYSFETGSTVNDGPKWVFCGAMSSALSELLDGLEYDEELCRCIPEFWITTESGKSYGVHMADGYARYGGGQTSLSTEQLAVIQTVLDWLSAI